MLPVSRPTAFERVLRLTRLGRGPALRCTVTPKWISLDPGAATASVELTSQGVRQSRLGVACTSCRGHPAGRVDLHQRHASSCAPMGVSDTIQQPEGPHDTSVRYPPSFGAASGDQ